MESDCIGVVEKKVRRIFENGAHLILEADKKDVLSVLLENTLEIGFEQFAMYPRS